MISHPPAGSRKKKCGGWQITDHICIRCFGRILQQPAPDGLSLFTCSNCGASAIGADASVLCCCGAKLHEQLPSGKVGPLTVDAGFRCMRNTNPTPEFPSEIVAKKVTC